MNLHLGNDRVYEAKLQPADEQFRCGLTQYQAQKTSAMILEKSVKAYEIL